MIDISSGLRCCVLTLVLLTASIAAAQPYTSWSVGNPLDDASAQQTVVYGNDGYIYLFGGYADLNGTYRYELATGTYTQLLNSPSDRHGACGDRLPDGRILIVGGTPDDSCEIYDPSNNSWAGCATSPTEHGWECAAVTGADGKLHVFGGEDDELAYSIYDPVADSWSSGPAMPHGRYSHGAAQGPDGRFYVFGGDVSLITMDVFDPGANSWSAGVPMPAENQQFAWASYGDWIFVLGGSTEYANHHAPYFDSVWRYDVSAGAWSVDTATLPTAVREANATVAGSTIHIFGGSDGDRVAHHQVGRILGRALLIQDVLPWGEAAWQTELALADVLTTEIPSADVAGTDLYEFSLVVVSSDQPDPYNANVNAAAAQFEDYLFSGGRVFYSVCDHGWQTQSEHLVPPYGGLYTDDPSSADTVIDASHPALTGVPLTITGSAASNGYLTGLPGSASALVVHGDTGEAVLYEYEVGCGTMLVSSQANELAWGQVWDGGPIITNSIDYLIHQWAYGGPDADGDGIGDECDPCVDADQDGFGDPSYDTSGCLEPGDDCDDSNPDINPIAWEICNGIDDDCNGLVDDDDPYVAEPNVWFYDLDNDGYGDSILVVLGCSQPPGYVAIDGDCELSNPDINPGADEVCNGIDDDCDSLIDDDDPDIIGQGSWYADADIDGYGNPLDSVLSCHEPLGYVADHTDCADGNPDINPGEVEVCNGIDDDCDTLMDDDDPDVVGQVPWYGDSDSDNFGDAGDVLLACDAPVGYVADHTDCNDGDAGVNPAVTEVCNGVDDDCSGTIDDQYALDASTWYADLDADGYGDAADPQVACDQPVDHVANGTDCDDSVADVHPGATETCNSVDDDCNGTVDDDYAVDAPTWYDDTDTDTFGDPADALAACTQPLGYVADHSDCDDGNGNVHPNAQEVCNTIDDDCDALVDDDDLDVNDQETWYADGDSDTYGDAGTTMVACFQPNGYLTDDSDCDDTDPDVHPSAVEACNGYDDDCDTLVDDNDTAVAGQSTWYADNDQDGFGDPLDSQTLCAQPGGYIVDHADCDDTDAAVNPAATEECNGFDDDCDGLVDGADPDVTNPPTWYRDADGDGFGDVHDSLVQCGPPNGYVLDDTDCDDGNTFVHPGAVEICNQGVDDDCDAATDENADTDQDGFSICDGDCDEDDALVHPDAEEICDNGVDNDCDSSTDENVDGDHDGYTICQDDCDDDNADANPGEKAELCDGFDTDCDGSLLIDEVDEDEDDQMVCEGDCDDDDDTVGDGFPELCDQIDNDCDDEIDEDVDEDLDSDGYNACQGDCDNEDADMCPGNAEVCDGKDNDCADGLPADEEDADGDGLMACEGDCDDLRDDVHPDLDEDCEDGIDNNCDGLVDDEDEVACPESGDDDTSDDDAADSTGGCDCQGDQAGSWQVDVTPTVLLWIGTIILFWRRYS